MTSKTPAQPDLFSAFGKTSPESSAWETTPSAVSWAELSDTMMPSCRLSGSGGPVSVWLPGHGHGRHGGFSTLNTSASPNDARVSFLWQILEAGPIPLKYFLSAKACSGILRRAAARKKLATMPELLRRALEDVVQSGPPAASISAPMVACNGSKPVALCLLADSAGSGDLERENMIAVCSTGDHTHTLTAEGFDASEDGTGRGTPIVAFGSKDHGADASFDVCPTLRAGGHHKSHANAEVPPAIIYAFTTEQTPKFSKDLAFTVTKQSPTGGGQIQCVATPSVCQYLVRRLTPTECARLQGIPDDHCRITYRGKPAADGPIYKAIGNGMAVPVIRDLLDRAGGRTPPPRGAALAFCAANAKEE